MFLEKIKQQDEKNFPKPQKRDREKQQKSNGTQQSTDETKTNDSMVSQTTLSKEKITDEIKKKNDSMVSQTILSEEQMSALKEMYINFPNLSLIINT